MSNVAACGMDEEAFRAFHARTARPLRAYLARLSRDPALAEDLLQESYLRFLGARLPQDADEAYRRGYLYRIATNLLRDHLRQRRAQEARDERHLRETVASVAGRGDGVADAFALRSDLAGALERLKPRERQMLWLAYVERFSHREIAAMIGFSPGSVRPLLFRARHKLAGLLRARGLLPRAAPAARAARETETLRDMTAVRDTTAVCDTAAEQDTTAEQRVVAARRGGKR